MKANNDDVITSEVKFRLGDLYSNKVIGSNSHDILTINTDIKDNRASLYLTPDITDILSNNKHLKLPCCSSDRADSTHGYVFSFARSTGDYKTGVLNDKWIERIDGIRNWLACSHTTSKIENVAMKYIFRDLRKQEHNYNNWKQNHPRFSTQDQITNIDIIKYNIEKPFETKQCVLFWRGAKTEGYNQYQLKYNYDKKDMVRCDVVEFYKQCPDNRVDMSFENKIHMRDMIYNACTKYKYLIDLQGNDVGSGSYWIYGTNCIIFRPEFVKSNNIYDHYLKPWEHYVPVDCRKFDDIIDKIIWCENNTEKCLQIIANANEIDNIIHNKLHRRNVNRLIAEKIKNNLIITI
tara:strand:+ start:1724 stop:2770 length:1047 start_codon:yes stop_codon:yes gene_type:complete